MSANGSPPPSPAQALSAAAPGATQSRENAELRQCVEALRAYLEYQRSTGVDALPLGRTPDVLVAGAARASEIDSPASPPITLSASVAAEATRPSTSAKDAAAASCLEELRGEIGDCRRCKLWSGRTQLVFGVGNPNADLMFVGEGPGRDEDLKGEPFVGRAGQLLTEIITKGMTLRREDVYIANVVKCRPPENRNPETDEIAACRPFLERQIDLVRPRVIVALGKFAAQTLLESDVPISRLRGHWHDYRGIKLMPTLHPAYLLRNPADKRLVWEDVKQVMRELGVTR